MSTQANWERGCFYFWVSKSALTMTRIGPKIARSVLGKYLVCLLDKPAPDKIKDYHRVDVVVIRTKKEAAQVDREWAKRRAARASGGEGRKI
jgi:hypothetical protein